MKESLKNFIMNKNFPCLMAKAVAKKGNFFVRRFTEINSETSMNILQEIYAFIDSYREKPDQLSSFVVSFTDEKYLNFQNFEDDFWKLLDDMKIFDSRLYMHDKRVSELSEDPRYSYSLKEEAFFILMLHPESPRWARRYKYPSIVFNPHQQFEKLRQRGKFKKIRDMIRSRDKKLQGFSNPMLNDHGRSSEIYQYTGKVYKGNELKDIFKEKVYL